MTVVTSKGFSASQAIAATHSMGCAYIFFRHSHDVAQDAMGSKTLHAAMQAQYA